LIDFLDALIATRNPEIRNEIRGRELIVDSSDIIRCFLRATLRDRLIEGGVALQKDDICRSEDTTRFTGTQLRDLST
jgi:hypothetical protein